MTTNLVRNARVFFTANVKTDGSVRIGTGTGETPAHQGTAVGTAAFTQELQVLDGFSFSQGTTAETITLNESGSTPARGQRSFNSSLDPVEWSFSTYIRPQYVEGGTVVAGPDNDDRVLCEERVLWNALLTSDVITGSSAAYSETLGQTTGPVAPFARIVCTNSNRNQLQPFGLIVVFDNQTYIIDNCAVESATVDFGIDQIGTIQWTGRGTALRRLSTNVTITTDGTFATGLTGTYATKVTTAGYITNKLSTARLVSLANQFGLGASATYDLAITGGSITIANNLNYLVPANIGVINKAIGYYTGTRAVTGSITAYMRATANNTAALFDQMVSSTGADDENMYAVTLGMGGSVTAPTTTSTENKLLFFCPQAMLQLPQINSEQVVTATINFTAQGGNGTATTAGSSYDITANNEVAITYYAAGS